MSDQALANSVAELNKTVRGWLAAADVRLKKAADELGKVTKGYHDFVKNAEGTLKYLHRREIDLLGDQYSDQLFYPVLIPLSSAQENRILIEKSYAGGNRSSKELLGLRLSLLVQGGSWGGNPMTIMVLQNAQTYQQAVGALGFMSHGYTLGVYLRGGHKYTIRSSKNAEPRVLSKRTEYFKRDAAPQYNLTAGPVDAATAAAASGALKSKSSLHEHNFYIKSLGDL